MSKYYAHAFGGTQVDEYVGAAPARSQLCPPSASPTQAQWDDTEIPEESFCMATSSKTNAQCRAYPKKGEIYCHFHGKQMSGSDGAES